MEVVLDLDVRLRGTEWLAGPRRVLRLSVHPAHVSTPPAGPGGPLWQVNQTLVE